MFHLAKFRPFIFCFLLLLSFHGHSQNREIDSLKTLLLDTKIHDTTRLGIIGSILGYTRAGDSMSVHYNTIVGKIVFRNLKKKNLSKELRNTYYLYAAYWYCDKASEIFSAKNGQQVLYYYDKAISLFKRLGMEEERWITVTNKGNILRKMNAHEDAITCYFQALKHQELTGDVLGAAATTSSIGQVYDDQGNFSKAINYYQKALVTYRSIKEKTTQDLFEMAVILHNIGFAYYNKQNLEEAKKYYFQSLKIAKENGFSNHLAFDANKIGDIYLDQKNYDEAIKLFEEGLRYVEEDRSAASLLLSMGELYLEKGMLGKSESYSLKGLEKALKLHDSGMLQRSYDNLYQLYKAMKKPDQALKMFELYIREKEAINEEEAKNILAQQELKYNYEKKELLTKIKQEKKIAALKVSNEQKTARKDKMLYLLIAAVLVLLIGCLLVYYYFRQKNIRNMHKNNELKQKLLLTQMNPHFIFNVLNSIEAYIVESEPEKARSLVQKFAKLSRMILENSTQPLSTLESEWKVNKIYTDIEHIRFGKHFDYRFEVEKRLDLRQYLIPPMMLQPLIENAILHGLRYERELGASLLVTATETDKHIEIKVIDNGSGLSNAKAETPGYKKKSFGLSSIKDRIEILKVGLNVTEY